MLVLALLLACGSGSSISRSRQNDTTASAVSDVQGTTSNAHRTVAEEVAPSTGHARQARVIRLSNLREGPGTVFPIADEVPKDTAVELLSYRDEGGERWYEVQVGDTYGWMSTVVLEADEETVEQLSQNTETFAFPPTRTLEPQPVAPQEPANQSCDPSYPDVCIPPKYEAGDLDCSDVEYRRFRVVGSDPHRFDADDDGIGCER